VVGHVTKLLFSHLPTKFCVQVELAVLSTVPDPSYIYI